MITTNQKIAAEEEDGMGFHPGFPPGFDPNRAAKGLPQLDCVCGHSRGRHITAIHGQILGKCQASECVCEKFVADAATA